MPRKKTFHIGRLSREYKDLLDSPLPNVSIFVKEENLLEWHVNITPFSGPLHGVAFHLLLR